MGILINIFVSAVTVLSTLWGIYNFIPLGTFEALERESPQRLGAVLTTIQGTDTLRDSRTTINDNFTILNNYKVENASSSIAAITTLSNLVTVGALSGGSLASGFTTVT